MLEQNKVKLEIIDIKKEIDNGFLKIEERESEVRRHRNVMKQNSELRTQIMDINQKLEQLLNNINYFERNPSKHSKTPQQIQFLVNTQNEAHEKLQSLMEAFNSMVKVNADNSSSTQNRNNRNDVNFASGSRNDKMLAQDISNQVNQQEDMLDSVLINVGNMQKQAKGIREELLVHDELIDRVNVKMDENIERGGIINMEIMKIQKEGTFCITIEIFIFAVLDMILLWWVLMN